MNKFNVQTRKATFAMVKFYNFFINIYVYMHV